MKLPLIPLEITGLTKTFPGPTEPVVAIRNVNFQVEEGEFVCILGHSGCGKSTVLSIVAGLQQPTLGGVVIDAKEIVGAGPDRGVVFQAPCLLPWLTARDNVLLAMTRDRRGSSAANRARADSYLDLVGVADSADQLPSALSMGTQQCVSLARALSCDPRFLLLDEPFSMLDSLTRFDLQDTLLDVWEQTAKTVLMVTHDVDEALYLADRLILMTDGPAATVGAVHVIPFERPRSRTSVLEHPQYYPCRQKVIDFLEHHARQTRNAAVA